MKKLKNIIFMILIMVLIVPGYVRAEGEKQETNKEPVKVYFFHGNGCPHCEETSEWFESIEEEYGDYFDVISYEVWYNQENNQLKQEVSDFRGDNATGVPYIIVGNYSYPKGFGPNSKANETQTMGEQLIERIMEIYNSDNRYDIMKAMNDKPNYDVVVAVVAGVIVVGLGAIVIISRKQNRED